MFAHVTAWGYFWLLWLLSAVGVEAYWLAVNAANTLSEEVWGIERLDLAHPLDLSQWTPLHVALTIAIWALFAWLSVHLPFGYLR